jgi:hypothetical protein
MKEEKFIVWCIDSFLRDSQCCNMYSIPKRELLKLEKLEARSSKPAARPSNARYFAKYLVPLPYLCTSYLSLRVPSHTFSPLRTLILRRCPVPRLCLFRLIQ